MGNKVSPEKEPLLVQKIITVYCERSNQNKDVTLTEKGLQIPLSQDLRRTRTISYSTITEMQYYALWPWMCSNEDILYIGTSKHGQLWFGGKGCRKLYKAMLKIDPSLNNVIIKE